MGRAGSLQEPEDCFRKESGRQGVFSVLKASGSLSWLLSLAVVAGKQSAQKLGGGCAPPPTSIYKNKRQARFDLQVKIILNKISKLKIHLFKRNMVK